MDIFGYTYYKNSYRGELGEEEFRHLSPSACDVVSLLVGFDCSECGDDNILRALCLECDCLSRQSRSSGSITRETLGDMTVEYDLGGSCEAFGCDISGDVVAALTRSGYLTRWA